MAFIIDKYFPDLKPKQKEKFSLLGPVYEEWNRKINVISRKDFENFYVHHVLHSLAIQRVINLSAGTKVLDVGRPIYPIPRTQIFANFTNSP